MDIRLLIRYGILYLRLSVSHLLKHLIAYRSVVLDVQQQHKPAPTDSPKIPHISPFLHVH